jgi:prepilin-type N-terminal cleavage/methylation domain-containing protein
MIRKRFDPAKLKQCLSGNKVSLSDKRGMTLLELLLATVVMAMVIGMMSLSLSGSIRILDGTLEQDALYRRANIALSRMSEDIAGAILIEGTGFVGKREESNGRRADSLRFASSTHLRFEPESGQDGLGYIHYQVEPADEGSKELVLYRSDRLILPEESEGDNDQGGEGDPGFILCDRLRSVEFLFVDRQGEEHEEWTTDTQDEQRQEETPVLPAAVLCRLELWLDTEEETSLQFETSVLLPVGLIHGDEESDAG